jgi:hypothetical protein
MSMEEQATATEAGKEELKELHEISSDLYTVIASIEEGHCCLHFLSANARSNNICIGTAANAQVSQMYYSNFNDNITAKWCIVVQGWLLKMFCSCRPVHLERGSVADAHMAEWDGCLP